MCCRLTLLVRHFNFASIDLRRTEPGVNWPMSDKFLSMRSVLDEVAATDRTCGDLRWNRSAVREHEDEDKNRLVGFSEQIDDRVPRSWKIDIVERRTRNVDVPVALGRYCYPGEAHILEGQFRPSW